MYLKLYVLESIIIEERSPYGLKFSIEDVDIWI